MTPSGTDAVYVANALVLCLKRKEKEKQIRRWTKGWLQTKTTKRTQKS
jgi:hypothetical protein